MNCIYDYSEKTVLITGANSGIGRATALAFSKSGAQVFLTGKNLGALEKTQTECEQLGAKAAVLTCDVRDESEISAAIKNCLQTFGSLHFAFNNAGIEGEVGNTTRCSLENWDNVLDTNLRGVWLSMKHEIPAILSSGGGAIVNCSSVSGHVGFQMAPAYVASKHGVIGLTKAAALEFAKSPIRVNCVSPGMVETPMTKRTAANPNLRRLLIACEPMGRFAEPEEIAQGVLWLCSDGSSFVTGESLSIDGGWLAQ